MVDKSGVGKVKEREIVKVAEAEIESRYADSIDRKLVADIVSSLSSERTLKVALNVVSDDLSVTTEVLGSKILVEEDGEL